MELQTLHNSSAASLRRGKVKTYAALPHWRLVRMMGLAILSIVCFILIGCSGQRDATQMGNEQEREALASDLPSPSDGMDYDPWESINDKTFYFNFNLADHYAIKPAAKVWSHLPEQFRQSLANAFYNLDMPKRFVNKVLQGRLPAAGLELARFVVNTTVGVAGLFDVASRLPQIPSRSRSPVTGGTAGSAPLAWPEYSLPISFATSNLIVCRCVSR